MANQQLFDYIRQSLASGATKEDIRSALINVGWPQEEVDEALGSISLGAGSLPFQVNPVKEAQKEKKKVLAKVLFILFFIIFVISGSALYYYFIQLPRSVLTQVPSRILNSTSFTYSLNQASGETITVPDASRDYYDKIIKRFNEYGKDVFSILSAKREILNGDNVYHYQIKINQNELGWFIQSMIEIDAERRYDEFSFRQKEELSKLIERMQNFSIGIQNIDIYVGQNNFYLKKIVINIASQSKAINDKLLDLAGNFIIDISDIGRSVNQEELRDLKSLTESIKENFDIVISN